MDGGVEVARSSRRWENARGREKSCWETWETVVVTWERERVRLRGRDGRQTPSASRQIPTQERMSTPLGVARFLTCCGMLDTFSVSLLCISLYVHLWSNTYVGMCNLFRTLSLLFRMEVMASTHPVSFNGGYNLSVIRVRRVYTGSKSHKIRLIKTKLVVGSFWYSWTSEGYSFGRWWPVYVYRV